MEERLEEQPSGTLQDCICPGARLTNRRAVIDNILIASILALPTTHRDYHSKVLQRPIDVEAELAELPGEWLEDLNIDHMLRRPYLEPSLNKFKVKAGQSLEDWEKAGWIRPIDPRGWFQWYYRFYLGRRSEDDARQIGRWLKACGPGGRFRKSLAVNVSKHGGGWDDPTIHSVVRQTLWQWGYDLTEADYQAYL